jgi:hypothetical protein
VAIAVALELLAERSVAELCQALEIPTDRWRHWRAGSRDLPAKAVEYISRMLGIPGELVNTPLEQKAWARQAPMPPETRKKRRKYLMTSCKVKESERWIK